VALPGCGTDAESSGGEGERATRVVREEEVQALVNRLGIGIGREEIGLAFRVRTTAISGLLVWWAS